MATWWVNQRETYQAERQGGYLFAPILGASTTYTCTVIVTADMTNIATVTGQPSDSGGTPLPGTTPVTDDDDAVVDVIHPAIHLVKTVGPSTAVQTPDGETYYLLRGALSATSSSSPTRATPT